MEHCNSCICKNVDIKHYYYYYYYHYIMDTRLKLGRGSLITIVSTIHFNVFSTWLAGISMSVPKYIGAYEMDGYNDVFVIFSPW